MTRILTSASILFLLAGCQVEGRTVGGKADTDCTDCSDTDATTCYIDADYDGHGNGEYPKTFPGTECPEGYAAVGDDWCDGDDSNWQYDDCQAVGEIDQDGDGYEAGEDCDDTDAAVYPGATESCNNIDDDCDGEVDESGASGASTWYTDADGDGFGNSASPVSSCNQPFPGAVLEGDDCDDTNDTIYPGAPESYNGVDDNCDGNVDEGTQAELNTSWLTVSGNTLSIVGSVFRSVDSDGTRVVGYGFGGSNDWSYSNGQVTTYANGWFSYTFEDGIFRVSFVDEDEWAAYEGYCVSPNEGVASPLCWANQGGLQGSGYSLCLGVENGVIYDPTDTVCNGTPLP